MNRKLITILIGFVTLAPVLAFAQSDTSNSNASEIAILEQLVITLTKELEQLIASRAASTTTAQTPVASTAPSTSYSSYTPVAFEQLQNNPTGYTGQTILVEGMENTFLPSTNSGNTNFIEVTNLFDTSQPKLMFEVDSQSNYTAVVNALQSKYYPLIRVYGTGMPDKNFSLTSAFQTTTVSLPVISVSRVDWCPNAFQNTVYNGSSLEDDEGCPSWTTIAPASLAGTTYPTTPSSPQPPTTPIPPVSSTAPAPTCTLTASAAPYTQGVWQAHLSWTFTAGAIATITSNGSSIKLEWPTTTISNSPGATFVDTTITKNTEYDMSVSLGGRTGSCTAVATIPAASSSQTTPTQATSTPPVSNSSDANQTITFNALPDKTYGDPDFYVSATASSGYTVFFTESGSCEAVSGNGGSLVHITGVGSCTVTAYQTGDTGYSPAPDVSQTFTIASPTASQ